jgi:hypothetical protein
MQFSLLLALSLASQGPWRWLELEAGLPAVMVSLRSSSPTFQWRFSVFASDSMAVGLSLRRCFAPAVGALLGLVSKWLVPRRRGRSPSPEFDLEEEEDEGLDHVFKFSLWSFMLNSWTLCNSIVL